MSSASVHQDIVNLYICYIIDTCPGDLNAEFTLGNCLFGSVELTKTTNPDKQKYYRYGIGFDTRSDFPLPDGSAGKSVIIFGVENSFSVHIDGKKKILILGEGPTQGLDNATIIAEVKYPINFTNSRKIFQLSLHYNGSNSFLFVYATNYQFKAKFPEMKPYILCLGNISEDLTIDNMDNMKKKKD